MEDDIEPEDAQNYFQNFDRSHGNTPSSGQHRWHNLHIQCAHMFRKIKQRVTGQDKPCFHWHHADRDRIVASQLVRYDKDWHFVAI